MAFVVFEGIDGSGKTSLIQRLKVHLQTLDQPLVVTREPGGSALGDAIRALLIDPNSEAPTPRAELLLYQASRAQHVDLRIRPALERGEWVICDRFTASSIAYQAGARGLSEAEVAWLNSFATAHLEPDLTVLLDLDPKAAQARRQQRELVSGEAADRFEREKLAFHEKVRASYLEQAKAAKKPWLVLSAEQSEEAVFAGLVHHLRGLQWPGF